VESRFDSTRIEALSDGVFAIAITLLVLEISVPEDAYKHLGRAILHEWPSYLAYVTSFLTIGAAWFVHHGIFRRLARADFVVVRLNLIFLMVVSFLPFPTQLLAAGVRGREAERTAVLFYGAVLAVMLFMISVLCRYVSSHPELLHPQARATELEDLARQITPGLGFYAAVLALSIVAPHLAAFGYLAVAILGVVSPRVGALG
jgi:uncharacterized membrane protein